MKVLITGATGLVGKELATELIIDGHELIILSRDKERAKAKLNLPADYYNWEPASELAPKEAVQKADCVINLMGENLSAKRWSSKQKEKIYNSRVIGTKNLVQSINDHRDTPLEVFISTSAIGIYKANTNKPLDEGSAHGEDYLAKVCIDWENASKNVNAKRIFNPRLGVVIAPNDGMMAQVLPLFRMGLGGPIGLGKQMMSWIHVEDLVRIYKQALSDNQFKGAFNAVAPQAVTNAKFSKALAKAIGVPNYFIAPPVMLKLVFGEMSQLMLDSVHVRALALEKESFKFNYPTIESAMEDVCNGTVKEAQFISRPVHEIISFFRTPENLSKLTPKEMNFKMLEGSDPEVKDKAIFNYQFNKYGLPMKWQSRIEDDENEAVFIDIQTKGPYKKWVHTHEFHSSKNGTLILDKVKYNMPFGILGNLALPIVQKDISKIFEYRKKALNEIFR